MCLISGMILGSCLTYIWTDAEADNSQKRAIMCATGGIILGLAGIGLATLHGSIPPAPYIQW